MPVDWDSAVLAPIERVFGEGGGAGGSIMYHPYGGGAPYPIDGIFDAAWRDINLGDPLVEAVTAQPVLGVRLAALKALPQQDDIVFIPSAGKRFLVKKVRNDSHGSALLILGAMKA